MSREQKNREESSGRTASSYDSNLKPRFSSKQSKQDWVWPDVSEIGDFVIAFYINCNYLNIFYKMLFWLQFLLRRHFRGLIQLALFAAQVGCGLGHLDVTHAAANSLDNLF